MTTVKILIAMGFIATLAGCASSVPETSSRFYFSPSYETLTGID